MLHTGDIYCALYSICGRPFDLSPGFDPLNLKIHLRTAAAAYSKLSSTYTPGTSTHRHHRGHECLPLPFYPSVKSALSPNHECSFYYGERNSNALLSMSYLKYSIQENRCIIQEIIGLSRQKSMQLLHIFIIDLILLCLVWYRVPIYSRPPS